MTSSSGVGGLHPDDVWWRGWRGILNGRNIDDVIYGRPLWFYLGLYWHGKESLLHRQNALTDFCTIRWRLIQQFQLPNTTSTTRCISSLAPWVRSTGNCCRHTNCEAFIQQRCAICLFGTACLLVFWHLVDFDQPYECTILCAGNSTDHWTASVPTISATNVHINCGLVWFILRPCRPDNGYIDCRLLI